MVNLNKIQHNNNGVCLLREFSQVVAVSVLLYGCTMYHYETPGEKARRELQKYPACRFKLMLEAAPWKISAARPSAPHLTHRPSKT